MRDLLRLDAVAQEVAVVRGLPEREGPVLSGLDIDFIECSISLLYTDHHMRGVESKLFIQSKRLFFAGSIYASNDVGVDTIHTHQGKLRLLMDGKLCMHESLVTGISLGNLTHMPLANMRCVITRIL